jgi:hypothetical protein
MSIADFITKRLVQTAVYWGNPQEDGYGGQTFDDPVEIACRWENKDQVLGTITGNQVIGYQDICRATVFVNQDLDEEGFLYLGTLSDLDALEDSSGDSSGGWYNPHKVVGAHIIKRFEKTPAIGSTTVFLRKAFLTPWLT